MNVVWCGIRCARESRSPVLCFWDRPSLDSESTRKLAAIRLRRAGAGRTARRQRTSQGQAAGRRIACGNGWCVIAWFGPQIIIAVNRFVLGARALDLDARCVGASGMFGAESAASLEFAFMGEMRSALK
jgi:hypothetical protein